MKRGVTKRHRWDVDELRKAIFAAIPEGRVVPRHNDEGHFYEVLDGKFAVPPIYPSVTGKLQILKDEGLINYKMNRAVEYVFGHYKDFRDDNIMEHLDKAAHVSQDVLLDAGTTGTLIHDIRETIFASWIKTGEHPGDFLKFIPEGVVDLRVVSAIRALQKFVDDNGYVPVATELYVYSHKMKLAGALDDLGLMWWTVRKGKDGCAHESVTVNEDKTIEYCPACDRKRIWSFVLMDLKSSNQFKDHYFYQVSLYWDMFRKLLDQAGFGWAVPDQCFILKVSKEDGRPKIEDLKRPAMLARYAGHVLKVNEGTQFIRSLRKDNQRIVGTL